MRDALGSMYISLVEFFVDEGGIVEIERLMWHMGYPVFRVVVVFLEILPVLQVLEVVKAWLIITVMKVLRKILVLEEDLELAFLGEVIRK
jgi:hypothetical protein